MTFRFILPLVLLFSFQLAANVTCPVTADQQKGLREKIGELEQKKAYLRAFLGGKSIGNGALSSLFDFNLEDSQEVDAAKLELGQAKLEILKCSEATSQQLIATYHSLVLEINKMRGEFLSLSDKQRNALLQLQREANKNQLEIEAAIETGEKAELKIEETKKAIKEAEVLTLNSDSSALRDLAAELASLEKVRNSIAQRVAQISKAMESSAKDYQEQTKKLSGLATYSGDIKTIFYEVVVEWRAIVDQVITGQSLPKPKVDIKLGKIRKDLVQKVDRDVNKGFIEKYLSAYDQAERELLALKSLATKRSELARDQQYKKLILTGKIRSHGLRILEREGIDSPFKITEVYLQDLFREIKLIPYRPSALILTGWGNVKSTASKGLQGVFEILSALFALSFFVIIPLVTVFTLKKLLVMIEDSRRKTIRTSRKQAKYLALLYAAKPYLPWLIMLIALGISKRIVDGTELEWVSEILPYFNFYFIYKLFRVLVNNNLITINKISKNKLTRQLKNRIEKTSKYLGLFFLVAAVLLEATATVARRALFYRIVWDLLIVLTPIVMAIAAYYWRKEIAWASKQLLSEKIYLKVEDYLSGPFAFVFALPVAMLIVLNRSFIRIKEEVLEIDKIKSLSAQLFKKKLESNQEQVPETKSVEVSDDYKSYFRPQHLSEEKFFVTIPGSPLEKMNNLFADWLKGESEVHSLALYGEKGAGKTTLLNFLTVNCEVVRANIENKITTKEDLINFFRKDLAMELGNEEDLSDALHNYDKKLSSKKVFIIDNAQNFFLSHRMGFEAYRELSSLLTLRIDNIFWCLSFDLYSWQYLNAVSNGSQVFREVIRLPSFDDESIKELILSRHQETGLVLDFDPIIYSLNPNRSDENFQYVQEKFFELLWEQSRGNPRAALAFWLSSLRPLGLKRLRVGIPGGKISQKVEGLTEEEFFVIASVVKHGGLTTAEAVRTTGLDQAIVQHVMRVGASRGFLTRSRLGIYKVNAIWHPTVLRELVGRNMLYG